MNLTKKQLSNDITFGFTDAIRPFRTHLEAGLKSNETIISYIKAVQLARDFLLNLGLPDNVSAITGEHLELFFADLGKRNSSATVVNRFKGLRAIFNWLEAEGEIKESPMRRMNWPKLDEKPPKACLIDDVMKLLNSCDRSFRGRRDAALIGVLIDTGWRTGEVLKMTVDMVISSERISVPAKGRKVVTAKLTSTIQKLVDRYLRVRNSDQIELWLSSWERPMDRHAVWEMLEHRSKLAGINRVNPHMLRHSHALWWLKEGGNLMDLKENLGHSSIRTTERYLKFMAQDRALEARKKFGPGNLLR